MLKFKRRALIRAATAGALAVGCTLGVAGASQASTAAAKPGVVSDFAVKNGSVTTGGATFTWARDDGATSYRIVVLNASTPAGGAAYDSGDAVTGTSDTVMKLAAGTAYEARISADNAAGASQWSPWVFFYTTAAPGERGANGSPGPRGAAGPRGAEGPRGPQGSSGVVSTQTYTLKSDANGNSDSIPTGGSFLSKAKSAGAVWLPAGTYLLNLNFMATPNATASNDALIFPQGFVYNGVAKSDFSNDLFNIGSGALAPYNASDPSDQINSYYSGTNEITVPKGGETLDVYAFGYDSDQSASSYELNLATLTATALNVAG
jgi:hypothetical protein